MITKLLPKHLVLYVQSLKEPCLPIHYFPFTAFYVSQAVAVEHENTKDKFLGRMTTGSIKKAPLDAKVKPSKYCMDLQSQLHIS